MTRPYMSSYTSYGYHDQQYAQPSLHGSSPMQGVEMQYSPAYGQDVSRQQTLGQPQPHQTYGQFTQSSIMSPVTQPPMYEAMHHYQQRQSAAIEVMSSQLGALPPYLQQSEPGGLQISTGSSHYESSQPESSQYTATRGTLPSSYAPGGVEYSLVEQQATQSQSHQLPQPSAAEQEALQDGIRQYQQQLRSTFDSIVAARLTEASEKLLQISRWLVTNIVPLGLHHDDKDRYEERLVLWQQFNLCWEALGQKQKDLMEQALQSEKASADILSADAMVRLVDELVAMCDQLEGYGLVDYELGIAEEQICHIFTVCLDLVQQREGANTQLRQSRHPP